MCPDLIAAIASSGWVMDVSSLFLMHIFFITGRWGFVRLASLGLGLMLWYVAVRVGLTLTSLLLSPTRGPYTLTWASARRQAVV